MIKIKKIVSLVLCLAIVLLAFPTFAQSDDIKWVCKKSTRINTSTGELQYPNLPEGYADFFTDWGGISAETADWWGHALHVDSSGWLSYNVPSEGTGVYELFVTAGTYENYPATVETEVNGILRATAVIDTCDWEPNEKVSLGYIPLEQGDNSIKVSLTLTSGGPLALQYFSLSALEAPSVLGFKAGNESFENGESIKRGTDSISIICTNPFSADSAENVEISLSDQEAGNIPVNISADENVLTLSLLKTLSYEEEYTLSVSGLQDAYGYTIEDFQVSFFTLGEEADGGAAFAVINDAPDLYNTNIITAKGQIKNSLGDGIEGRKAQLEIKSPDLSTVAIADAVSLEEGCVEFSYRLGEDAPAGKYKLILSCEYCESAFEKEIRYISNELKSQILGEIESASDAENIESIFNMYSQELGIDLSVLDGENGEESGAVTRYGITDKSKFFERFAGMSFESIEAFADAYELNLALEIFLQNTSPQDRKVIVLNEENAAVLGIDTGIAENISEENIAAFWEDVALIVRENADTKEKLVAAYNSVANKYFLLQNSKENIVLDIDDASAYVGQQMEIILNSTGLYDLYDYTISVSAEREAAEKFGLETENGNKVTKTVDDEAVNFKIENTDGAVLENLGRLTYDTESVQTLSVTISGKVTYKTADFDYLMYAEIEPSTINLKTSEKQGSSSPGYSSSPVGGGGGGGSKKPSSEEESPVNSGEDEKDSTKKDFSDLESVSWAADSINYLYNKGVISDSEDNKFRPNDNVTRAEFIKMLVMSVGIYSKDAESDFTDVNKNEWYYKFVASAQESGIIAGDEKNCFNPQSNITRQDICVILSRIMTTLGYEETSYESFFADDYEISGYAKNAVYRLFDYGIINGMGNNIFAPKAPATRAMTAKMLVEFLKGVKVG